MFDQIILRSTTSKPPQDLERERMAPIIELDPGFEFKGIPSIPTVTPNISGGGASPLGPLAALPGTWKGTGFNAIWRPHNPSNPQDRFLELNLTDETLVFTEINGAIPNRGLLMPDISLFGVTYLQQISEANGGPGLHIEPGIWAVVPPTTDPSEPATVVRMASIPHGTVILAQGTTQFLQGGPPFIPGNNIIPFSIGSSPPSNSDFAQAEQEFPELNLSRNTAFRHATQGVTQAMVENPNSLLAAVIEGKPMVNRAFIEISTTNNPISRGGGVANTAFLDAGADPPGANATAVEMDATFWIQTLPGPAGQPDILQLQYTQRVQLDFNGLRWPHVSIATLQKQ
jgi:hypothetical protein